MSKSERAPRAAYGTAEVLNGGRSTSTAAAQAAAHEREGAAHRGAVTPPTGPRKGLRPPFFAALALAGLLAGCTSPAEPSAQTPATSSASTPSPSTGTATSAAKPTAPIPTASGGAPMDEHDQEQLDVPTLDDQAAAAAVKRARQAMSAWARPDLEAATWTAELAPLLSPAAQAAYQGTDPANVPADHVGGAELEESSTGWQARVRVATNDGNYRVTLSRQFDGAWLVERMSRVEAKP